MEKGFLRRAIYFGVGAMTGMILLGADHIRDVKIFPRENKPAVMRIYRPGPDKIMIQNRADPSSYNVGLEDYLRTIEDLDKRDAELREISELIDW